MPIFKGKLLNPLCTDLRRDGQVMH